MGDIDLDELARWTGEPLDELRHWSEVGLLPDDGTALAERIERVRLIRFAIERGYDPQRLADVTAAHGDVVGRFAEQIAPMVGEPVCTADEAAEDAGIDAETFDRIWSASGLRDEPFAADADVAAIRLLKTALDASLPEEVLTQMLRVSCDSTWKIADAGSRLFHLRVHEQLRSGGMGGEELLRVTNTMGDPLLAVLEPTVTYFHRKAWQRAMREDMMLHLAEEETAASSVPGEFTRAVLFADLSSFTPLTEVMGDAAAARVVSRFSELVREAAARCSGQVVKQIGDEFMLVFADGRSAVACGLAIRRQATAEPQFPALRIGAHVGSVLYREGDYVGNTVNLAARVTSAAARGQFLVTDAVRRELDDPALEVADVGSHALKGLSDEVALFSVRRVGESVNRPMDPVCGMELDEASADARLNWEGARLLFCSEGCLRRFVEDPDRYSSAAVDG